jgi:hypothetical protein
MELNWIMNGRDRLGASGIARALLTLFFFYFNRLSLRLTNSVTRTRLNLSRFLTSKSKHLPLSASKRSLVVSSKKCKYTWKHSRAHQLLETNVMFIVVRLVRTLPVSWLSSTKLNVNNSVFSIKRRASLLLISVSRRLVLCVELWLLSKSPRRPFVNKRRKLTSLFASMLLRLKSPSPLLLLHDVLFQWINCRALLFLFPV